MKKLSIIIPYHNEDEEKITPMFSSLDAQFNVDWSMVEIIVSNDHNSPKNIDNFFKMFPRVNRVLRYLQCPIHIGPGPNRQYAVDNSTGEYIVFMDSDDLILSGQLVHKLIELTELNKDMYVSPILIDTKDETYDIIEQKIMTYNNGFLHGKMFRKEYLLSKNIRFDDELRYYEDSYYIQILKHSCPDVYVYDNVWYWYKFNDSSMTHNEEKFSNDMYKDWINLPIKIISYCIKNDVQLYKTINFYLWLLQNRYLLKESEYSWIPANILEDSIGYVINKFDPELSIIKMSINETDEKNYLSWLKKCRDNIDMSAFESLYGEQLKTNHWKKMK